MSRTAAIVVALGSITAGCGAVQRRPAPGPARKPTRTVTTPAIPSPATTLTSARPNPKPKPKPNPGALPQTGQLPAAGTAQFHAEMTALWSGVTQDSLAAALPAFFPEGAYAQVKAITDPQADYRGRLLAGYRLDLGAAHSLLGPRPRAARLLRVEVPRSYAHWVSPGACYNRVGYYEVPNARVVYTQGGAVRSFGIASMISWRGVWYVVHLGAVLRPGTGGVVDDPRSGPGQSIPSSTC